MKYGYYPGCSLNSTAKEYDISLRAICSRLGIELTEVKNWICCGSSAAHAVSNLLAYSLPIWNLSNMEREGIGKVIVPCAACFSRFKFALYEIDNNPATMTEINEIIGHRFENKVKVLHPLEVFNNSEELWFSMLDNIKDLSNIKVVCYYGCLLTRPSKVMQFDICEYPMSMDNILKRLKMNVMDWSYKTDCCGASLALTRTEVVLKLTHEIMENAEAVGAETIAVACPLCHANLDTRQAEVNLKYKKNFHLPILYFTQFIGLALGLSAKELGMDKNLVSPESLLNKIC